MNKIIFALPAPLSINSQPNLPPQLNSYPRVEFTRVWKEVAGVNTAVWLCECGYTVTNWMPGELEIVLSQHISDVHRLDVRNIL